MLIVLLLCSGVVQTRAQSTAHAFGAPRFNEEGNFTLELLGTAPTLYARYFDLFPIEASTDLGTWVEIATVVRTNLANGPRVFEESTATGTPQRFFRMPTNAFPTALAKPTGPYAVGRTVRVATDPSRTNRYGIANNASWMVTIWYPAANPTGTPPATYLDAPIAAPLAEPHLGSSGDVASRLAGFHAFARTNLPIAGGGELLPVVLYSHGYSFHRQESSEKLEELASHGFVAVAMDHVDCRATVFPDGKSARGVFTDNPTPELIRNSVSGRLADDIEVIRLLEELNRTDSLLAGRLDLDRLGAMGWSLGNSDLGELVLKNDRFRGIVMLEGYLQGSPDLQEAVLSRGMRAPLLALYQEGFEDTALLDQAARAATQDAYLGLVRIGDHFAFKDLTETGLANDAARRAAVAMRACVLSFFDKYLRGIDDHLLDNPTNRFPALFHYVRSR
ncbi:MAG: hypothetical protein AB7O66_07360 [Limisphaerales bacterium]